MKIDFFDDTMYEGIVDIESDDIDLTIPCAGIDLKIVREEGCYYSAYFAGKTAPIWNLIGRFYYEQDFDGCN